MENKYWKKYKKYKYKYLLLKNDIQTGGNNSNLIKLEGVTPDLYIPKNVAIVGNAPALLEKDHTMIDKHECVIRVNCTALDNEEYKSKAGSKCDIFIIAWTGDQKDYMDKFLNILKDNKYHKSKIICRQKTAHDFLINNGINTNLVYLMDLSSKYYCNWSVKNCLNKVNIDDDIRVDPKDHKDINNKDGKKFPTTGFVSIMFALASGIKPTLYGFSKEKSENLKTLSHIYLVNNQKDIELRKRSERHVGEHDIPKEHEIINKLIVNNLIVFIE